ncbi:MAG: alpha/beta hydrolase [Spirochaetaceae bacterium]|nr:alpha/beta hydrolase [Spirochaetaceae bacterium]
MSNPLLFKDYEGAPWLTHIEKEPSPAAKKRIPELFAEQAPYPMAPGNELVYLDDSTPSTLIRQDVDAPHGLHLYSYKFKQPDPKEKRVIYYIHGGGFMRGNGKWCRKNAISLAVNLGLPVYACEYRYTPEHKYPAGVDDSTWGWDYLVNKLGIDPGNIIVSGESAGGTYAMALCVRLKRQGRPLPGKAVILSGYLDFALESPSYKLNREVDPVFNVDLAPTVPFYLDDLSKVKDPEVSPKYADFTGFPPTFFCVDDAEVFLSDALIVADKMHKLGIPVKVYVSHGLIHVFPFEMPEVPESQDAFKAMKKFLG